MPFLIPLGVLIIIYILGGIKVIDEYERGVILTLGKYTKTIGPGLHFVFPIIQKMLKADLRVTTVDIPQQEAITKDNVPVGINAVVYFKVENAERALLRVEDYSYAVSQYAMAALRDVIGGVELDQVLSERKSLAEEIKMVVDEATDGWGIDVTAVKMQDIELPADMKRVMAKQAESEREKRAVIIKAEGELKASEKLAQAASKLKSAPGGMSLRTLETIENVQPDPSKNIIFALPVEIMEGIKNISKNITKDNDTQS